MSREFLQFAVELDSLLLLAASVVNEIFDDAPGNPH